MGRFIVRRTNGEERAANRDCLWLSLFFFPLDLQRTRLATRLINIRRGKLVCNFFEYVFRVRRPFSLARNYAKLSFEKLFVGATSGP